MSKKSALLIILIALVAFTPPQRKIKIFLAGDSTMSVKEIKAYPETGWGMPFAYFWDSTVQVVNLAKNGRSTSSFRKEGLWDKIMNDCSAGDYVLIQFGHNDEVPAKKTYTTETEFKSNLERFVTEVSAKGGQPVLITPVARRKFNTAGKIEGTHEVYSGMVRSVAAALKVPLIDLDHQAQELYQQMGAENSKRLFNYLQPGEHPNYPAGKADDTHFSELGARKIAELVLADIRTLLPGLAERIVKPAIKK